MTYDIFYYCYDNNDHTTTVHTYVIAFIEKKTSKRRRRLQSFHIIIHNTIVLCLDISHTHIYIYIYTLYIYLYILQYVIHLREPLHGITTLTFINSFMLVYYLQRGGR